MKAGEKDHNRRYETAKDFAVGTQCYLADEPVLVRSPAAGDRMWKFARKHLSGVPGDTKSNPVRQGGNPYEIGGRCLAGRV